MIDIDYEIKLKDGTKVKFVKPRSPEFILEVLFKGQTIYIHDVPTKKGKINGHFKLDESQIGMSALSYFSDYRAKLILKEVEGEDM